MCCCNEAVIYGRSVDDAWSVFWYIRMHLRLNATSFYFAFFLQWRTNLNNSIFLETSTFYGLLRLLSIRFWSNERGYHIIIYHLSFNFVQSFVSKDSFPEGSQYVFLHNQVKSFAFLAFGLMSLFLFAVPCNDDFPNSFYWCGCRGSCGSGIYSMLRACSM